MVVSPRPGLPPGHDRSRREKKEKGIEVRFWSPQKEYSAGLEHLTQITPTPPFSRLAPTCDFRRKHEGCVSW